ncbi:relaxase/mobilization nuclease domain-containing protein [Phytohabitans houttuyneae]|uniref:MobA/VirD2-like nuclease domain-containing protein n=1 Tax=Phytohabitans houttuyneae TaxID=1076126 RepID=A0A6V8KL08_9ACTN|nr:relaxase/mobilization nuclease domain-containing protein [Phytohabitans houttuyneae]GFJ85783.1 hypothetical protein Phou_099630 [Phytohabitans houttuyneae]
MPARAGAARRRRLRDPPEAALIPQVHKRGTKVGGLLAYLFGPGKREEHRNPRLVAAWDGAANLTALQPQLGAGGKHSLKQLTQLLEQPVRTAADRPALTVWHCSVRNHPTDRTLSDQQWQHIAQELVAGVGLAPHGDDQAVRWVAVRHADDHIHIVATLVRQDGRNAWAWNDRYKAQNVARDLERRYNLHRVAPTDHTTHRHPTAAEQNKTRRQGRAEIPRDQLRREVRAAAAAATGEADFLDRLAANGVLVRLRHSTNNPGQVTGYAVGLPQHHTADGETVWYGGGRLAPDLTLPRLRRRWHGGHASATVKPIADRVRHRTKAFRRAATATGRQVERLARQTGGVDDLGPLAEAAADVFASTARALEGRERGGLGEIVDIFDRAVRDARPPRSSRSGDAAELRSMARLIAVMGRLTDDEDTAAALRLLQQIAGFADNLAVIRDAQRRRHQAAAARQASNRLRILVAQYETSVIASQTTTISTATRINRRSWPQRGRSA